MRTLVWAELRGAWSSWLAVLIAFIATSFAIVLALLLLDSMTATIATGQVPAVQAPALQFIPAWNLALAAIGTLSVIGAVTGLVVQSRRGALARLSLAGATPGQVSRIVLAQLLIVSVGGAVLGILFAIALQPAAMQMILGDRGVAAQAAVIRVSPLSIAIGSIGFVLFALLAGLRQARVAAAIAPVEALRAASGVPNRRRGVARWIGAGLLTLAIIGLAVGTTTLAPELGPDGADSVLQVSVICMLLSGAVLSLCAPLTVGLLTRAWTALIPSRSAPGCSPAPRSSPRASASPAPSRRSLSRSACSSDWAPSSPRPWRCSPRSDTPVLKAPPSCRCWCSSPSCSSCRSRAASAWC